MKKIVCVFVLLIVTISSCTDKKPQTNNDELDPPPRDTTEVIESSEPDSLESDTIVINE